MNTRRILISKIFAEPALYYTMSVLNVQSRTCIFRGSADAVHTTKERRQCVLTRDLDLGKRPGAVSRRNNIGEAMYAKKVKLPIILVDKTYFFYKVFLCHKTILLK